MRNKIVSLLVALAVVFSTMAFTREQSNVITLTKANHTSLVGEVNETSIQTIISSMEQRNKSKEFYLYISSPGGDILAGMRMMDYLKTQHNVTCIVSRAMSAAFAIMQTCEKRVITPVGLVMQHQGWTSIQGNEDQLKSALNVLHALMIAMNRVQAERIGITVEEFARRVKNEWWIAGGKEVVEAKVADSIGSAVCSAELNKKHKELVPGLFGDVEIEVTDCPLTH